MSEVQAVHWIIYIKESFIIAYWSVVKFNFLFRRSKQGYTLFFLAQGVYFHNMQMPYKILDKPFKRKYAS